MASPGQRLRHGQCRAAGDDLSGLTEPAASALRGIAIEQFNVDVLRPAQECDTHARPDGFRFDREFDTFLLQLGDDCVDLFDPKPDVFEAEIRRLRRVADCLLLRGLVRQILPPRRD